MTYRIVVERNRLRFAAAHFATYGGNLEPLHGHNYAVTVELEGSLAPDSWVLDFGDLKTIARKLCKQLHHKLILQVSGGLLDISKAGGEYTVKFGKRRYVTPVGEVAALEIENTTAERLAEWFAERIAAEVTSRGATNVTTVHVGIEEMPGQSGWCELAIKQ